MNKKTAARELLYGISKGCDGKNTNIDGHTPIGRMHKILNNVVSIPMKERNKQTDIIIPPITANHRQTAVGHPLIEHLLIALERRTKLMQYCRLIADVQAIFALTSIILMIIAEELIFRLDPTQTRSNEPTATTILKSLIVFLSIIQFILVLFYWNFHLILVNLADNQPQSRRLALTRSRFVHILFELLILIILPYPCFNRYTLNSNETHGTNAYVTPDVALSLPMFLRLYFIYRALVQHTQAMKNVGTGPIAYLNNIHFGFTACEFHKDTGHLAYSAACWLYSVTFTTVGYGDISPSTDGGRIVSSIVGLWGVVSVALVIAIIRQYLQMSASEQYIFEYNMRLEINKKRKYYLGNLIKFTVKAWHLRLHNNDKGQEYRRVQQKVYQAIDHLRVLRRQQLREFVDEKESNEQQINSRMIKDIQNRLDQIDAKLDRFSQLETKLDRLTQLMDQHDALPTLDNSSAYRTF